ncbi:hypothetical protein SFUMM280S_03859 [Streptomyces fumanus]
MQARAAPRRSRFRAAPNTCAVLVDEVLELGEGLVQRGSRRCPRRTVAGMVRSSSGGSARSALVTAMAVGTRGSPSQPGGLPALLRHTRMTSLRDYFSTVSTGL